MKCAELVDDLLAHLKKREKDSNYDPGDSLNTTIESNFIVQVLLYKLDKMKIDVIFPFEALCILALCAEKPSFIQIMAKEVLTTAMNRNNGSLPHGYVIRSDDIILTWNGKYPVVDDNQKAYEEYENKWRQQKTSDLTYTDNKCDTYNWWHEIIFNDEV